jgi:transketolase
MDNKPYIDEIRDLKRRMLKSLYLSKEGHLPSSFSVLDLLYVIYRDAISIGQDTSVKNQLILSKGHASLALYAVLARFGYIGFQELDGFGGRESRLGGHPDRNKVPGVVASTGSLGHGLPIAVGMSIAKNLDDDNGSIYVIVGDGEINEGTTWESLLLIEEHRLVNLCLIVDLNHSGDRAIKLGDVKSKFQGFDFEIVEIDGHNEKEISEAINMDIRLKPKVVIANTVKGYGLSAIENDPAWHHRVPNDSEYAELLQALL